MAKGILVTLWFAVSVGGISARQLKQPIMATLFQGHNEQEALSNHTIPEYGLQEANVKSCKESIEQEFQHDQLDPYLERILLVLEEQERQLIAKICATILALNGFPPETSKSAEKLVGLVAQGFGEAHRYHESQTLGKKKDLSCGCTPKIVRPEPARAHTDEREKNGLSEKNVENVPW